MEGPRAANNQELETILSLVNLVFRSGVNQDMASDYPLVFDKKNLNNLRVVLEKGEIISHAAMAERTLNANDCVLPMSMICAVATHPVYRKRGSATSIMADAVTSMALRGDAFGLLWTGPARDFYRQLGWEVIGTNGWTYILRPTQFNHFKSYCLVRAYQQGKDLNRIIEIHQNQSEQLTRNQSAYQTLFNIPTIKIWVAEENNLVTGYLVVAEAHNKSGVIEWGGTTKALSSLLAHVLSTTLETRLQVFVPSFKNPMKTLLQSLGCQERIPMEEADGCGLKMIRILSLKNLLEKLKPHIQNCLGKSSGELGIVVAETAERTSLKWKNKHFTVGTEQVSEEKTLTLRETAQFIFGPMKPSSVTSLSPETAKALDQVFPFTFHIGMLDYV